MVTGATEKCRVSEDRAEGSAPGVTAARWVPTLGCPGRAPLGPASWAYLTISRLVARLLELNPPSKNNAKCLKEYENSLKAAKSEQGHAGFGHFLGERGNPGRKESRVH